MSIQDTKKAMSSSRWNRTTKPLDSHLKLLSAPGLFELDAAEPGVEVAGNSSEQTRHTSGKSTRQEKRRASIAIFSLISLHLERYNSMLIERL
jgi:hypothetical protein